MSQIITLILFLFTAGCSFSSGSEREAILANARKYLPYKYQKEILLRALDEKDFDPEVNLIRQYIPSTANRYHAKMVDTTVHPLRESAMYASDLLDTGISGYRQRAFKIFEKVIAYQDQDTASNTYGIWPYYYEESLDQMARPDWNWADFIGVQLLEAYMRHQQVLPEDLKTKMEASIIHASRSIQERDVQPSYTNIALMGTLVTYLTSRLFDINDMKAYTNKRLERFYRYTEKLGGFEEYNSPTYTMVALDVLIRMKQYILDPEARNMIDYCYKMGWSILASHFHPATGQLAGPQSRCYSTFLRKDFYDMLYGASDGKIKYKSAVTPYRYYKKRHRIPERMIASFINTDREEERVDTFDTGTNPVTGYTYLHPSYSLGTANRSTTWKQRRPLIAYWGTSKDTRYFRPRLLHDFIDFAVGNIFSVQEKNKGLTALNFATNGGDYHLLFDRLPNGKFKAKDLRLRFEFGGSDLLDKISVRDRELIVVEDGEIRLGIKLLYAKFGGENITIKKGRDGNTCWVDVIIYSGEERSFDLSKIGNAAFAWAYSISHRSNAQSSLLRETEAVLQDEQIHLKWDDMRLSVPAKPDTEQYLQNNFSTSKPAAP